MAVKEKVFSGCCTLVDKMGLLLLFATGSIRLVPENDKAGYITVDTSNALCFIGGIYSVKLKGSRCDVECCIFVTKGFIAARTGKGYSQDITVDTLDVLSFIRGISSGKLKRSCDTECCIYVTRRI